MKLNWHWIGNITSYLQRVVTYWQYPLSYVTFQSRGHATNIKPYISPSTIPMATKIGRVVTYVDAAPPSKSHDLLFTWLMEKTYICTSAISMTTKLGRVLTWGWGTQSSKLVNFWLCGHMTKEKNLISALMQYLWPSNLAGC